MNAQKAKFAFRTQESEGDLGHCPCCWWYLSSVAIFMRLLCKWNLLLQLLLQMILFV